MVVCWVYQTTNDDLALLFELVQVKGQARSSPACTIFRAPRCFRTSSSLEPSLLSPVASAAKPALQPVKLQLPNVGTYAKPLPPMPAMPAAVNK